MGETTAIAWTDHTFNPWWGCVNVSPGCDNCYAETFAKRTGHNVWGDSERRFFGAKHWDEPLTWNRKAREDGERGLVFCASMADVFEMNHALDAERDHLFDLIDATPHLIWQLLTKRPENVLRLAPERWLANWPAHVWLGTTAEDQIRAAIRIPRLLAVPGVAVRFLSCEPLIDEVSIASWLPTGGIGWVIVGGESGPGHRVLNLDHARRLRAECEFHGVPFFFKQVGGQYPTSGGDELDGEVLKAFPA